MPSAGDKIITVDMGSPLLRWEEIPLARAMDTVQIDFEAGGLGARWRRQHGQSARRLFCERRACGSDRDVWGPRSSMIRCSRSG
jgi:hypothetical protein